MANPSFVYNPPMTPYLDILYSETQDLLHDRLGRAVIRLASIWQYCWEQAGKPALP